MALTLDGTTGITSDSGTPVIENLNTTDTGIDVTGQLTTTGNVGINTSSPAGNLHVYADGTNVDIQTSNNSNYPKIRFKGAGGAVGGQVSGLGGAAGVGFYYGTTEAARIDSDGLKFNGDTSAANALDDYEEGTFTPVFADDATGGNTSPTVAYGLYTKIGNLVYICMNLTNIDTTGLTAGNTIYIRNLPFTSLNSSVFHAGSIFGRITCNGKYLTPRIIGNVSYCTIDDNPGTASNPTASVVSAIVDDGGDIRMSLTYLAE